MISGGIDATGFDPHYFPNLPNEKFDVIVCFYVLNVLFEEEQNEVLMKVSSLLKSGGKAYFAVRRDIKNDGFRTHYIHKKPTYQCQVHLPFKSIFRNANTESCEYQPYTQLQFESSTCPFCKPKPTFKLIAASGYCYAILSPYPEGRGHTLILPKRHIESYFDLSFDE
jgi:SAM-dependent methyltransferase